MKGTESTSDYRPHLVQSIVVIPFEADAQPTKKTIQGIVSMADYEKHIAERIEVRIPENTKQPNSRMEHDFIFAFFGCIVGIHNDFVWEVTFPLGYMQQICQNY